MGFEELAGLKQLLSKRTQAEKPGRGDASARTPTSTQPGEAQAAKTARPQAAKPKTSADARKPAGKFGGKPDGRRNGSGPARGTNSGSEAQKASQQARPPRPEKRQTPPVEPVVITISQLQKRFPNAFPKNPAPKVPLKLGISKDILAQAESMSFSEPELLEAIKVWCQGSRYWAAMTKGAARVDLDGNPEGLVTPEQAARARSLAAASRRAKRPAPAKKAEGTDAAAATTEASSAGTPAAAAPVAEAEASVNDAQATPAAPTSPSTSAASDASDTAAVTQDGDTQENANAS